MRMNKKIKRQLAKILISCVSFLVVLSLFLHFASNPTPTTFIICYSGDSVDIGLKGDSVRLPNIYIERVGIPGAMVFYEGVMIIAFMDAWSYRYNKTAPIVEETNQDGVSLAVTQSYVTAGPYAFMPYELTGSREHVPGSEGKLFVFNSRNNDLFYQKSRRIIY
jgi:hypothetical protein